MSDTGTTTQENFVADTRAKVLDIINTHRISKTALATETGISLSAVSGWLSGKYAGDNEKLADTMSRWLAHQEMKRENASVMPRGPEFITTPTAQKIHSTLAYGQLAADLVVIYGGAGVGKTRSIEAYAAANPNVFVMESTPSSGTLGGFLRCLGSALKVQIPVGHNDALDIAIRDRLKNTGGLLIVDEAQFLQERALEAVRRIAELAGVGLAICGNEVVYTQLTGRHRAANFAQLYSRIGKRLRLTRPSKEDALAIITAWKISGAGEQAMLLDIASKPGGLRSITKVLRLASMIANGQQEPVNLLHLRAAWADLGADT
jgi:DNA transposition AAA+ family ATPase